MWENDVDWPVGVFGVLDMLIITDACCLRGNLSFSQAA
jgi:hypothetical protein